LISNLTKRLQYKNGEIIASETNVLIRLLQEGMGGIRDILIDGTQELHYTLFKNHDNVFRNTISKSLFVSQSPRYFLEALAMLGIASTAFILIQDNNGILNSIPLLGSLALGVQRLLPLFQQIYSSLSNIQANKASVLEAILLLEQPLPNERYKVRTSPITFKNEICLNNLGYRYKHNSPWIFQNLELKIKKGSRIGIIGQTGSGKSTLLDIIMGLLAPTDGSLKIDGIEINRENVQSWQQNIAHVPQIIFLSDSTIEENIAFGVEKSLIDHERVKNAAKAGPNF
jgi:ATP-binding cassette subfamily B protein